MRRSSAFTTTLVALTFAGAGWRAIQAAPPAIAGDWVRNAELSDDPREKMAMRRGGPGGRPGGGGPGAAGPGGGGPGAGPGGGGSGPRGGGGPGGPGGPGGNGGMAARGEGGRMRPPELAGAEVLHISEDSGIVTISVYGRPDRILRADGRTEKLESPPPFPDMPAPPGGEVTARYKGERLVVTTAMDTGRTVTESYEVSSDGRRLTLKVSAKGGERPSMDLEHVYDRQTAKTAEDAPGRPTPSGNE